MKNILSISLGASSRDHVTQFEMLGETFRFERRGTDGDFERALDLYREADGKVDAIGVGGIEFSVSIGERKWYFRDAKKIRERVSRSKLGDGNRVKSLLANRAVRALEEHLAQQGRTLRGMKALKTTALDRIGMAEALVRAGCDCTFGDFMFTLGIDLPLKTLRSIEVFARLLLPVVTLLPYRWLYPTGERQADRPSTKWARYYADADIIAGDFLQIRTYIPRDLSRKIVLTNTTTRADVEDLRSRGASLLVTTTPRLDGRSFGTNMIEAALLSVIPKPEPEVTRGELESLIERAGLQPCVEILNG